MTNTVKKASIIIKATKVELEGAGAVTIRPGDYLTEGGEGAVYRKGKHIIKLYENPQQRQQSGMGEKVQLLRSKLSHPSIVAPSGIVTKNGGMVGIYMPYAKADPLSPYFTNDYRGQVGFTDTDATSLATAMYDVVGHAHQADTLMVDANEYNWLVQTKNNVRTPYVIDVDSWAVDRWPATALMPSIRDWHMPSHGPQLQFNELTDWYAWGIVTFQLFTGIHPFKGKMDGYKTAELERRMRDNVSVFAPDVRLNHAVRDFACIPGPLLDWYQETFTSTTRNLPPSPQETGTTKRAVLRTMRTVITSTGGLQYEKLFEVLSDKVVSVWPCGVARTESGALYRLDSKMVIGRTDAKRMAVVSRDNGWLLAEDIAGEWQFRFIKHDRSETTLTTMLPAQHVLRSGERLFVVTETALVEVDVFGKVLVPGSTRAIMSQSSRWYRGVGIEDALGATHLLAPFGDQAVAHVRVPALDGVKVIDVVAGPRSVTALTGDKAGGYQIQTLAFDAAWQKYTVNVEDVDQPELNIASLPKGVAATIKDDGEITISVPHQGEQKVIQDKDILTTMRLTNVGDRVVYRLDGALWSLRMR